MSAREILQRMMLQRERQPRETNGHRSGLSARRYSADSGPSPESVNSTQMPGLVVDTALAKTRGMRSRTPKLLKEHAPAIGPRLLTRECDRAASRDGVTAMPRLQARAVDRPGRVQWREDAIAGADHADQHLRGAAAGCRRARISPTTQRAE
jgi:hypothetical protein